MEIEFLSKTIVCNRNINRNNYHIKIYNLKYYYLTNIFENDFKYSKKASNLKIFNSPIIKKYKLRNKGIIVYKRLRYKTLDKYRFDKYGYLFNTITKLIYLVKKLHENNISHNDLNLRNIMYKKNKLCLIDFALSTQFVDNKQDLYAITNIMYNLSKQVNIFNKLRYFNIDEYILSFKEIEYEFVYK